MGSIEVHILGQNYVIKGDEQPEYIKQLADYVDGKLREVYSNAPGITPLRASILASLTIADELHKTKKDLKSVSKGLKDIEDKADTIIRLFD
ncbi:MAG: cell division protein ZapA [Nitrospirae bacterium]|nr:MAG: cell division protein ZapA [Nitrospirota bacterium]